MTSSFTVQKADGYEHLMGRWSRKLAAPFIAFAGVGAGETVLDVGCGTGSLTFALAEAADLSAIAAIDQSPIFVEAATGRNRDPRITIQQADATDLPFDDKSFDRAYALLVLHFVPEAAKAISEMRRVVRPGGVVAAAVWDHYGGMPGMRMVLDTIAALSESGRRLRNRYCFQPMVQPGEMRDAFTKAGLRQVSEAELAIRMTYADFNDLWAPIRSGEGPLGSYVSTLDVAEKAGIEEAVRDAYLSGRNDGPRSFVSVAWACRGTVA